MYLRHSKWPVLSPPFKDLHSALLWVIVATSVDLPLASRQADMPYSQLSCCSGGSLLLEALLGETEMLDESSRSWWSLSRWGCWWRAHRGQSQSSHQASDLGLDSWGRGLRGPPRPGNAVSKRQEMGL